MSELINEATFGRRQLLKGTAATALTMVAGGALLDACSSSKSGSSVTPFAREVSARPLRCAPSCDGSNAIAFSLLVYKKRGLAAMPVV